MNKLLNLIPRLDPNIHYVIVLSGFSGTSIPSLALQNALIKLFAHDRSLQPVEVLFEISFETHIPTVVNSQFIRKEIKWPIIHCHDVKNMKTLILGLNIQNLHKLICMAGSPCVDISMAARYKVRSLHGPDSRELYKWTAAVSY